jgi:hypothetical protein
MTGLLAADDGGAPGVGASLNIVAKGFPPAPFSAGAGPPGSCGKTACTSTAN